MLLELQNIQYRQHIILYVKRHLKFFGDIISYFKDCFQEYETASMLQKLPSPLALIFATRWRIETPNNQKSMKGKNIQADSAKKIWENVNRFQD